MSDYQGNQGGPAGAPQPNDPWAPPAGGAPQDKVPLDKPQSAPTPPSVHDQPTVIGTPGDTGSVPPPPVAPGGPAPGYGYPAATSLPQPPASGGFGAPTEGFGAPSDPYGAAHPGYAPYAGPMPGWAPSPANGMGITAMVLGILAVTIGWCYGVPALVLGLLALIFGIVGRKRAQRGEADNGGQALAGIIMGSIGLLIFVLWVVFFGLIIANADKFEDDTYDDDPFRSSLVTSVH